MKNNFCTKCCQKYYCVNRKFRDRVPQLSNMLNEIKQSELGTPIKPQLENSIEAKYRTYNYNGSFHKGLEHNLVDGRLVSNKTYENLKYAIVKDDQLLLRKIPMAPESTVKLVNPLASNCSVIVGAMQGDLTLDDPPSLCSATGAAEMVEVYAQAVARDVPFIDYESSAIIDNILKTNRLNNTFVISNLKYAPTQCGYFDFGTIFRGANYGCTIGPYISQLLLLKIVAGALVSSQQYLVPPTRSEGQLNNFRVEWGIDLRETIDMQNGALTKLPAGTPSTKLAPKYIYSGRSLAEAVHNDPAYQFFYQAGLILSSLGAKANYGWPNYANQGSFVTNNGAASLLCSISEVAGYALKHCWYWKWQHSRKLRPETFALWVHDVKTGLVENENNFDISEFLFDNKILDDIYALNNSWIMGADSYTLPQAYREGSPIHPAYISGHAIIAGACCTILKIYFDNNQLWTSLPGVISGTLSGIPGAVVQANSNGAALAAYVGSDIENITVAGEINKLAFNVAMGRDWAGIHYRSDAQQGLNLGEKVAIYYMEDMLSCMVENDLNGSPPKISFRKFDGSLTTIKPTLCK